MLNTPEEILKETMSDVAILNLRKDNILTIELQEGKTEQSLTSMKKDLDIFKEWTQDEKFGFLVDSRRFKKFDTELRVYAQQNVHYFADKYAIIISSGISSFLANIFIYINKPTIPTKTFTTKEDSINWLKE